MKLLDLNLLLYAVNEDSPLHAAAKGWLEQALTDDEPVAIPWVVILGFLRIATHPRILAKPLKSDQALTVVDSWLCRPTVRILHAGPEHWRILRGLLRESGTAGNLTTDAHLAAMAIESGCELCSTDGDFARFRHLRWANPISR